MAYAKVEQNVAGIGLTQSSVPNAIEITPIILDVAVASTTTLGIVKIGTGIEVTLDGVISATNSGDITTGTWTPALTPSVAGVISTITKTARYTKTGNLVTCIFDIVVTGITGGSSSATLKLSGLPFSSGASAGYVGSVSVGYFSDLNSNTNYISGSIISTSTQGDLWFQKEPNKSLSKLTQADIKTNTRLVGTVQYLSAV